MWVSKYRLVPPRPRPFLDKNPTKFALQFGSVSNPLYRPAYTGHSLHGGESRGVCYACATDNSVAEPHGRGELQLYFGERYMGEFADGMRSGLGEMVYANADHYVGARLATARLYSLTTHAGEFSSDYRHGRGFCRFANGAETRRKSQAAHALTQCAGDVYEGQWAYDRMHGTGQLVAVSRSSYSGAHPPPAWGWVNRPLTCGAGEFQDGVFGGLGVMEWPDGSRCAAALGLRSGCVSHTCADTRAYGATVSAMASAR
jgi:hypothetical protein